MAEQEIAFRQAPGDRWKIQGSDVLYGSLTDTLNSITELVRNALERCPPELSADLVDRGFILGGGGSLVRGIDHMLSEGTGIPVIVAEDPLSAVANGTGIVLQDLNWLLKNRVS